MAEENEPTAVDQRQAPDIEHLGKRLDMLDQRLDNIDSVVTAVVQRVMNQPLALNITCPNCGKSIEIAIIGSEKLKG